MLWLLLACGPKPALDAPAVQSGPVRLEVTPHADPGVRIGVSKPADVHVSRTEGVSVVRDGITVSGLCPADECWLDAVQPGEILELLSDGPTAVVLTPVPLPEPTPLPSEQPVIVSLEQHSALQPVPSADLAFSLDGPADVRLHIRPLHDSPDHRGRHLTSLDVYSARGRESASIFGQVQGQPGVQQDTFTLPAGEFRVRVRGEEPGDRDLYCMNDPEFGMVPPDWCAETVDDVVPDVSVTLEAITPLPPPPEAPPSNGAPPSEVLSEAPLPLTLPGRPAPAEHPVAVQRGEDVLINWTPAEAFVSWHARGDDELQVWSGCFAQPCVIPAAPFDRIDLAVADMTAPVPVSLEVWSLPPPRPVDGLEPGYEGAVMLEPVAVGDPRGPLVDVLLHVEEPGDYVVSAEFDPALGQASLEMLQTGPSWSHSAWNLLGSETFTGQRFTLHEAGSYVVRIQSGPDSQPQPIDLHFYPAEPLP